MKKIGLVRERRMSLALGTSLFALGIATGSPATAQCVTDSSAANIVVNCAGTDADGVSVTSSGTTVNVAADALVTASAVPAVTIDIPAHDYNATYATVNVLGRVQGNGTNGVTLYNGQTDSNYFFGPTAQLYLTVAPGGSIGGTTAVTLTESSGNTSSPPIATIDNSGTLTGSSGMALVATNPALGGFSSITNRAGGFIGAISGTVGTLTNAGTIDGGANSAINAGSGYYAISSGTWTNTGTITSAAGSATLDNLPSALENSGTISNIGNGAAIRGDYLTVTNDLGGQITTSGGSALSAASGLSLTNLGTIVGNVTAASASYSEFVDSSMGTISGNVALGAGDDVVVARYVGTPALATGVSGLLDAGGGTNTVQIAATQDTSINTPIALPASFQRLALAPAAGTTLTLDNGFVAPSTINLTGGGSIVNNATLAFTAQAFVASSPYPGISSFTNNGAITTTGGSAGTPALSLFFVPNFVNHGTINVVGDGVSAGINGTVINSGTIIATGTAVSVFDGVFDNSGTIISTGGIGVALSGNVGIPANNSGLIEGATVGVSTSIDLTNSGTIVATQAGGTAVALDAYGTLINTAAGVVGEGGTAVTASIFNSTVINAGTINGAVTLGNVYSFAGQRYIALTGGILNGDLTLGAGDLLVTDLVNNGPGAFAGITGSVNAASGALLRYRVSSDATATLGAVGPFQIAGYDLSNGATLTLSAPGTITQALQLAGNGTINLVAGLSASTMPAIQSTSVAYTPSGSTPTPTQLDITSAGTISLQRDPGSYPGAAVYLGSQDKFTNLGTISVVDGASYSPAAAIYGGANVINSGSILLDGGVGVSGSSALLNSGTITQVAGGATAQGVTGVGTLDNRGTIDVNGTAVQLGYNYFTGAPATLSNAGTIASSGGVAISGSGTITNLAGGTIGGGTGTAVQLSCATFVNAGAIKGTVDLGFGGTYYDGSSYRSYASSSYVAAGGTIAGDLLFGDGDDLFLQTGATTGVSGTVDGGGGQNIYGWSLGQSGTVALDGLTATRFQDRLVQATGASTLVTIGADAPFAGNVYLVGDGSIDNQATIIGTVQTGLPYALRGATNAGAPTLATFVNDGTLGGFSGSVASFTNNGIIKTNDAFQSSSYYFNSTVSLGNDGDLVFDNSGQISGSSAYAPTVSLYGQGQVSVFNTGQINGGSFFAPALSIYGQDRVSVVNSGAIVGGLQEQADFFSSDTPGNVSLSNSGMIGGGGYGAATVYANAYNGVGGTMAISNSGTIAGTSGAYSSGLSVLLYANNPATTLTIDNSGIISADAGSALVSPQGEATALYLGASAPASASIVNGRTGSIVATGAFSTGIVARGFSIDLDNSGVITGEGGVAVDLDDGDDHVTLRTGSNITGAILGGGGTNSATVIGSGLVRAADQTVASLINFDNLTVQSGYWTAPAANISTIARTIIDTGATLEVAAGDAGIAGYSSPSFIDNGTLVVRSSASSGGSTFGAAIVTGKGGVTFTGTGIAVLDSLNSLQNSGTNLIDTGSTLVLTGTQAGDFVNNGIFQIGIGGTSGDFTGNVVDNGVLMVARSGGTTFAGALSGAGTLVQIGNGRLAFGSNFAFAGTSVLNGGTIRFTAPVATTAKLDVEGAGQIDISGTQQTIAELAGDSSAIAVNIAGGSLTVDQSTMTNFAGSLVGDGSFTKAGAGSLNLVGNSNYTGATTVSNGLLTVDGGIASRVTIGTGGTLGGNGIVGGLSVESNGRVAPGDSIGTLHVLGNVSFAAGSIYQVQANAAGESDQIVAGGSAELNGGTVQLLAAPGSYANLTKYSILTAAGGVSGQFAGATSNLAFLTPVLTYSTNSVNLLLARNDIRFASMARTPNQAAVANAVEALPVANALHLAVLTQTAGTAPIAFNALSGEAQADVATALIDQSREIRTVLTDRMAVPETGLGLWAQGSGSWDQSGNRQALGRLLTNDHGVIGGFDVAAGSVRLGVFGGHSDGDMSSAMLATHVGVTTNIAGGYGDWTQGALAVRFGGSYSWHDLDSRRSINFPGFSATAYGHYKAHSDQLFGEISYAAIEGPFMLKPFVGVAHVNTTVDSFEETGTQAALGFARNSRDITFASAGLRAGGDVAVSSAVHVQPHLSVSYMHGWGDVDGSARATLAGAERYGLTGIGIGRDTAQLDGGFDFVVSQRVRLGVGYDATLSQTWSSQSVRATAGIRF